MKTQKTKLLPLALALATLGAVIQQARAASFVNTSPMNRARSYHSATLLPNGKVLVAGGYNSTTTELFDPATRTWTLTGRLNAYRHNPEATLLPNGKVLLEGGEQDNSFVLSSAELYNPASGTWTFTGAMQTRREGHTATLLSNGKVLVAGGFLSATGLCCFSVSSAELYDPASGRWTPTGSLNIARDSHTATLLTNGKVLVTGGNRSSDPSSAELYDPLTGTWTVTGSLSHGYSDHTATLLPNGKVLVAGGCPCRDNGGDNPSAEIYDPASGTWTPTGSMITGRGWHTATLLLNGKVLVAGGYSGGSSAELYDPTTETWTQTAAMSYGRLWHRATLLLNGNVLVSGGVNTSNFGNLSSAELYEPDSDGGRAFIFQQPIDVLVKIPPDPGSAPSTNATFSVVTFGTVPLAYQWRFNGAPIAGATNSTITITNVQLSDEGVYSVAVTDSVDTIFSNEARLYPLISPTIVQEPLSQTVIVGSPVTLSAAVTGHPKPFTFEWRRGSLRVATNVVSDAQDFFTFTAAATPSSTTYRVVVRNLANSLPGVASPFATITTVADSDGDGMADDWETSYGLNPASAADADEDGDGDGMTNQQEHAAGTDPTDGLSYLAVGLNQVDGVAEIHFGAVSNKTYSILRSDVPGGAWEKLTDVLARPTNRVEQVRDPAGRPIQFYRVVTPRQP
jgi:Immunoglobulin domain/Kelch motif/Galactose oxidase, central domain/Bacterial TSP3 repeat